MRVDQPHVRPRRSAGWPGIRRQRGSIAVMAAIWVMVAIVVLGAIDIGNLYLQRRDLQRIADMAALAAAQAAAPTNPTDMSCSSANQAAQSVAQLNDSYQVNTVAPVNGTDQIQSSCGRWDPPAAASGSSTYQIANASMACPQPSASPGTQSCPQLNAAQVTMTRKLRYSFLGMLWSTVAGPVTISATSTARAAAVDAFSIGTSLAMFGSNTDCNGNAITSSAYNPGLVNSLLSALLNTSLSFNIGTYQALACTRIKIDDLRAALQVGTVDQLLNGTASISKLANLMITALGRNSVANVQANVTESLKILNVLAKLNVLGPIALGNSSSTPGLLSIGLANTQNAANATVSLLDLLFTAAEIANANANSPAVSVNTGLNLLGLAQATLQVQVIRPPVIAIGEGGTDPTKPGNPWRTLAHTADIAVYLNVGLGTWGSLGALLPGLLDLSVRLPLYLEVAPGTAWLTSTSCAATRANSRANIVAQPGLANVCIGDAPLNSQGAMNVSGGYSCGSPQVATLMNVGVLNAVGLKTSVTATVPAISVPAVASVGGPMVFDGITGNSDDYQSVNSNQVGEVLTNALSGPAAALSKGTGLTVTATLLGVPITVGTSVIGDLLAMLSKTVLNGIFGALDQLLVPLLQLLGVQVGIATVHNMSLTCAIPQIVGN
nr:pilus assembly protein TadG-related protein [Burkholderia sp. IMCC1007]